MSRNVFWTLIILLTVTAAATVVVVCSRFVRAGKPDADYVIKTTKKKKAVQAAQAAAKLNHADKEELINSVIRQMKKKIRQHSGLPYAKQTGSFCSRNMKKISKKLKNFLWIC